jgi:hypothetical protein
LGPVDVRGGQLSIELLTPLITTGATVDAMNEKSHHATPRCDPFQMAMIHRTFRTEFGKLPDLIRLTAPGDVKRAKVVGGYLGDMLSVLHHHHAAEDDLLWPELMARATAAGSDVRHAEADHLDVAELMDGVESVRPSWARSGDPRLAEQLSTAVDELYARANEHFDHEEQNVVPLIAEHITQQEWQAVIDRGAAYVNPTNLWFSLAYAGVLLRGGTRDEQRRFIASIPLPLRIVLKLAGGRAFASYQTRLYGGCPEAGVSPTDVRLETDPPPRGERSSRGLWSQGRTNDACSGISTTGCHRTVGIDPWVGDGDSS